MYENKNFCFRVINVGNIERSIHSFFVLVQLKLWCKVKILVRDAKHTEFNFIDTIGMTKFGGGILQILMFIVPNRGDQQ